MKRIRKAVAKKDPLKGISKPVDIENPEGAVFHFVSKTPEELVEEERKRTEKIESEEKKISFKITTVDKLNEEAQKDQREPPVKK